MQVQIKWMSDHHECETCGTSYADGAIVTFENTIPAIHMIPHAHCYDGEDYDAETVYKEILRRLGHTVKDIYND